MTKQPKTFAVRLRGAAGQWAISHGATPSPRANFSHQSLVACLAKKAGVSRGTIERVFKGRPIMLPAAEKIAAAIGMSLALLSSEAIGLPVAEKKAPRLCICRKCRRSMVAPSPDEAFALILDDLAHEVPDIPESYYALPFNAGLKDTLASSPLFAPFDGR